mgnify:CR=1 FL=1
MRTQRLLALLVAATIAAFLAGCGKAPEVASPSCVDADKVTDPAQKAELLKKCPNLGPAFKPSPKKAY